MKPRMKTILDAFHKYNSENMAELAFGLRRDINYDAVVVAPSYTPYKLGMDKFCHVTTLHESVHEAGYLVEKDNLIIAWIRTGIGAGSCMDYMSVCGELRVKKYIFVGSVGALTPDHSLGELCTPSSSIEGALTNTYLKESLKDYVPFEKVYPTAYVDEMLEKLEQREIVLQKAPVFCTDSVALEYLHLDEIKELGAQLIEMETATFYRMTDLLEVPGIALLVVSDNSATGNALVGRSKQEQEIYERAKTELLPKAILEVCKVG